MKGQLDLVSVVYTRRRVLPLAASALTPTAAIFILLLFSILPAVSAQVQVIREVKHGLSPPLRGMALPRRDTGVLSDPDEEEEAPQPSALVGAQADPIVQAAPQTALGTIPGVHLLGLGSGFIGPQGAFQYTYTPPPDPNASVGASQIVETVNLSLAVFDKAGTPTLGPMSIASIWNGFDSSCSNAGQIADPAVLYDKQANRWVIEIVTLGTPYLSCFAVSTTSDATGAYHLYTFQVQASGYKATPRLGLWQDGYYTSARMYPDSTTYVGPGACAFDRNQMLAGHAATMQCFQIKDTTIDGMLPSDLDGRNPPPAGAPNYYLVQGPAGSNSLYLYRFHVDFINPANSTFLGPFTIGVAPYYRAPEGSVAQPGTSVKLDVNGNCLMHRLAYRNFPHASPPHESLVVTHSVMTGPASARRVGLRWYELRNPGTTPTLFQQGTYSPDATHRWMGSIAMDKMGNIAIGYSASSSTTPPSIRYTGRVPTDPRGTLESEVTIFGGNGSQTGGRRWGDYTSMSLDPTDDCTMWYTDEYMAATGSLNWATHLFSFKFPSCQ